MKPALRILLVGGGSGGHFYPLIALAEALQSAAQEVELYYMGPDPYDAPALSSLNITFMSCPSGKMRRYASIQNVIDPFKVLYGFIVALFKLYILYPDAVVSKGSHTSVPVVLAAAFLRIPIIVHESDTRPGRANRLASHLTSHIAISFEEARTHFSGSVILTGIPLRKAILAEPEGDPAKLVGVDPLKPTILVLGGSLGAERINQLILDSLDELLPQYNIIHQTGKDNFELTVLTARELIRSDEEGARYRPIAFFSDPATLSAAYHAASIVISRAGTGTIYEIAAHGKPSIIIPIPESISHDQRTNAYVYAQRGGAVVLEEGNLRDSLLTQEIERIMGDTELYRDMAEKARNFAPKNGAEALATLALEVAHTHA